MKVILSPTKQMKPVERTPLQIPHFIKDSAIICEALKQLTAEELRRLMKINEKLAEETKQRYAQLSFSMEGTAGFVYI